ncbi:DUF3265 domain-containing protein [Vibrio alginolyticus]|nr:DUF3265 domain-containing protein [Vibrio harveyi]MCR9453953.1 DUF3265 domain-containing protein [Vibrio alginolyticus]MCR9462517.1 DUF3265 domain-containing protein [Vibrio alginolyticus]
MVVVLCLARCHWWVRHITNCSRGIRNAWHFYYALDLVVKMVCGGFCIALLTP